MNSIRNFSIIAHIDHGKSTLADRMLQLTGTVEERQLREQFLDKIAIERERGITIKLQAVRMEYRGENSKYEARNSKPAENLGSSNSDNLGFRNSDLEIPDSEFILNLVDTPGHIDFSYEVSRALAACEGAILLVDASQGIQAQTLANYQKAVDSGLKIIPVVNKIDLTSAHPDEVAIDMAKTFNFKLDEILFTSAKEGTGVEKLLDEIVTRVPAPQANSSQSLRALIFDSFYDEHLGVIALVRVVDGAVETHRNAPLRLMHSKVDFEPVELGYITSKMTPTEKLATGEVGYVATGLKDIASVRVGDTVAQHLTSEVRCSPPDALPGYVEPKPMVFANLFPQDSDQLKDLRSAVEKYNLTDAAFTFEPINSPALGMGFRCGFLGLLHLDVVRQRLQGEFGIPTQITAPNVKYRVQKTDGSKVFVRSPEELPSPNETTASYEPWAAVEIYTLDNYLGDLMKISEDRRGKYRNLEYLGSARNNAESLGSAENRGNNRVKLTYQMPLAEIIAGFFYKVKSVSSGYASLDYEVNDYKEVDLARLDILLNKEKHEALSRLVIRSKAENIGQELVNKLKEELPRQQFSVPIQAAVGGNIVARADLPAQRKNVTAKLYGGDRTRKDKLLRKQAAGKKRLQEQGSVEVPGDVYQKVLTV